MIVYSLVPHQSQWFMASSMKARRFWLPPTARLNTKPLIKCRTPRELLLIEIDFNYSALVPTSGHVIRTWKTVGNRWVLPNMIRLWKSKASDSKVSKIQNLHRSALFIHKLFSFRFTNFNFNCRLLPFRRGNISN